MSITTEDKRLVAAILKYLNTKKSLTTDGDSVDVAIGVLEETFGITSSDKTYNDKPLEEIFASAIPKDSSNEETNPMFLKFLNALSSKGFFGNAEKGTPEYQAKYQQALDKFKATTAASASAAASSAPSAAAASAPAPAPKAVSSSVSNDETKAEACKVEGNSHFSAGRFREAVDSYTEAIEAAPTGANVHIYYNNRATAKFSLKDYDGAISDAELSTEAMPTFAKAYARIGAAYMEKNMDTEAVVALEKAIELDPSNAAFKEDLKKAKRKAAIAADAAASGGHTKKSSKNNAGAGMPDMDGLAAMLGGAGGGLGSAGGLGALLNNPNIQQMAKNLMSNPQAMQAAMSMLGGAGGGLGGLGGLSSMFGGMGGGAPGAEEENEEDEA